MRFFCSLFILSLVLSATNASAIQIKRITNNDYADKDVSINNHGHLSWGGWTTGSFSEQDLFWYDGKNINQVTNDHSGMRPRYIVDSDDISIVKKSSKTYLYDQNNPPALIANEIASNYSMDNNSNMTWSNHSIRFYNHSSGSMTTYSLGSQYNVVHAKLSGNNRMTVRYYDTDPVTNLSRSCVGLYDYVNDVFTPIVSRTITSNSFLSMPWVSYTDNTDVVLYYYKDDGSDLFHVMQWIADTGETKDVWQFNQSSPYIFINQSPNGRFITYALDGEIYLVDLVLDKMYAITNDDLTDLSPSVNNYGELAWIRDFDNVGNSSGYEVAMSTSAIPIPEPATFMLIGLSYFALMIKRKFSK